MSTRKSVNRASRLLQNLMPSGSCNSIVQPGGLHSHHDSTVLRGSSYEGY